MGFGGDGSVFEGLFWAMAAGIALLVALVLIRSLRKAQAAAPEAGQQDQTVYRDQLREIERDAARGTVSAEEAQRLRAEVARRLLEADRATPAAQASPGPAGPGIALAALTLSAAFGVYAVIGNPGVPDQPLSVRLALAEEQRAALPSQSAMEAEAPAAVQPQVVDPGFLALMDQLRTKMADRPDDLKGYQLLARNEARLGNFTAAYAAQREVVRIKANGVTADDHVVLATLMIQAAGGRVSREAEAELFAALKLNDSNDSAMFFLGIMNLQVGREDLAFRIWRKLIEVAPQESPWLEEVRPRMEELALIAGVPYRLPPPKSAVGPTPEMVEEAAQLPPEDRAAMIRGMVEQLNDRLAGEGGTSEDWGRLILSLGTLQETDRALAILAEARQRFAGKPEDLVKIEAAAQTAGLTP